jgi:hypothetical protein
MSDRAPSTVPSMSFNVLRANGLRGILEPPVEKHLA